MSNIFRLHAGKMTFLLVVLRKVIFRRPPGQQSSRKRDGIFGGLLGGWPYRSADDADNQRKQLIDGVVVEVFVDLSAVSP